MTYLKFYNIETATKEEICCFRCMLMGKKLTTVTAHSNQGTNLGSFGNDVGAQFHFDTALQGTPDGNVKEDDGVFGTHLRY